MKNDSGKSVRIAKNATALYIRMAIATAVSLYTSRIVLNELGIEGYGTYTLVAGIVTFWLFMNGSMTTASTRFLSVAVENGDEIKISKVFSSVFWVHFFIAVALIVLGESIGVWFFINKLKIIPELYWQAKVVYHLSIASVAIGIMQVPFTSMCIAQERMGIFAVLEILNSILKLNTACALVVITNHKLIVYAILLLLTAIILLSCYTIYSKRKFKESIRIQKYDNQEIKSILSFTSWDLYSNGADSLRMQGTAVLYNLFINTAANAALGISLQIHGIITSLANNIAMAIRPQITKSYVSANYDYMERLVISATKLMATMVLLFTIPLSVETPFVLHLWLGNYPEYTVGFTRLTLISIYFWTFSTLSHSIIHATGKVRKYSVISGTVVLCEVIIMYLLLRATYYAYIPQLLRIIVLIVLGIIMLRIIHSYIQTYNSKKFIIEIYLRGVITFCVCYIVPFAISTLYESGWAQLIMVTIASLFWVPCVVWMVFLKREERTLCLNFINSVIHKKKD